MLVWPKAVKAERECLTGGAAGYKLRHQEIGELGRILLTPAPGCGCIVTHEVFSSADGLMTRRLEILEPLTQLIMSALEQGIQKR